MRHVLLVLCSLAVHAPAQDQALVDKLARPMLEKKQTVGLAVGTFDGKAQHVFCYGKESAVRDSDVSARTLFEIGSITKTFTGVLLAELARDGKVKLDDTVAKHLPADVKLPVRGRAITLVDLATQSSGLPRMPRNFEPKNPADPYVDYDAAHLHDALRGVSLESDAGTHYAYSNLGVGLLGHALSRAAKKSYAELVAAHICDPLGMSDTRLTLDAQQQKRFADGHGGKQKPTSHWSFDVLAPAGGLRSSIADMLLYLRANVDADTSELAASLASAHEVRFTDPSSGQRVGLGWHVGKIPGHDVVWHNGATGGFTSFLGFVKATKLGVVVLNNSTASVDKLGMSLLQLMHERPTGAASKKSGGP